MNTIFQFIWFYTIKPFIKRKEGDGSLIVHYHKRIIAQVKLARLFKVKYLIIGDSNGENLATYSNMVQFGKELNSVIANIAIGGTRADSWVDYFRSLEGESLLDMLPEDVFIIFNIGGNHVLQEKMDLLPKAFRDLKLIVDRPSCNCLVPPVHHKIIDSVIKTVKDNITLCNKHIKAVWPGMWIDVHTPFADKNDEPFFFIHQDIVHFGDDVDKVMRIPIMVDAVKRFTKS